MPNPRSRQLAWLRDLHGALLSSAQDWGARLGTWLIVGNAGALALIFNAVIVGSSCDTGSLRLSAWLFSGGLAFAFLGAAASYVLSIRAGELVGEIVNTLAVGEMNKADLAEIEEEFGPQPEDSILPRSMAAQEKKASELSSRLTLLRRWGIRLLWLFAFSIALFAAGAIVPVGSGDFARSCSSATT